MRTPEQWLAYGDDLPVKLAEVLTPEPCKHTRNDFSWINTTHPYCRKCKRQATVDPTGKYKWILPEPCSVPDPIKIDWNTAMEWRDLIIEKHGRDIFLNMIRLVVAGDRKQTSIMFAGIVAHAQAKHYLIAAAMVVEGVKE